MKTKESNPRPIRRLAIFVLSLCLPLFSYSVASQAALDIPDTPLFLTSTGVRPNLVLTLDDSRSMMRGWVPQNLTLDQGTIDGPKFKSPTVNSLYYDPMITYNPPQRNDKSSGYYSTSFTSAYFNGFDPSRGTVNLANNYKVVGQSKTTHYYSNCPCDDSTSCSQWLDTNNDSGVCRLVKHPGEPSVIKEGECDLSFEEWPGDDAIISSGSSFCDTFFDGIEDGTEVEISNVNSDLNGTWIAKNPQPDHIRIGNTGSGYRDYYDIDDDTEDASPYPNARISWATGSSPHLRGVAAYYYLYYQDAGQSQPDGCNDSRDSDLCYVKIDVGSSDDISAGGPAQQKQNFANWYSFYRNRGLVAMSGAMIAINSLEHESVRLGWQDLTNCTSFGTSCRDAFGTTYANRLMNLTASRQSNFFNWLERFDLDGGSTPLRGALKRAGNYFKDSHVYQEDPYIDTGNVHSCRRNYHILFTDGLWNDTTSTPGDLDSSGSLTLPDGKTYTPRAPFRDENVPSRFSYDNPSSLGDIALDYWATDLSGALENNVPTYLSDPSTDETEEYWNPKNNPANWQHMVNYTISLGLSKSLVAECLYDTGSSPEDDPNNPNPGCPVWGGSTFSGDYGALLAGTKNWPWIRGNSSYTNSEPEGRIYDLWHAAINSRGKFYSADDPEQLVNAFQDVIDTISAIASSGGGAGLGSNTTQIDQEGAVVFEAKFNPDWSGRLLARPVEADFSLGTAYWDAGQEIPTEPERNIATMGTNGGASFDLGLCGSDSDLTTGLNQDGQGNIDNRCADRLYFLRGDGSIEGATCDDTGGTALGVYSVTDHHFDVGDEVRISDVEEASEADSTAFNGDFTIVAVGSSTFTVDLSEYVDDCTDVEPGVAGGRVHFKDFRDRAISILGDIIHSDPSYVDQEDFGYGVGSSDVTGSTNYASYVSGKASNRPVIYVGANDGMLHAFQADINQTNSGRELFAYVPRAVYANLSALTDPNYTHRYYVDGALDAHDAYLGSWGTYLAGSLGAGGKSIFALDVSDPFNFAPADDVLWEFSDTDLGYTFSAPQIAATAPSQWAVIFGNGYNSDALKGYLYVVNLSTGNLLAKIEAGSGIANNGLSTAYLHDSDGNKIIDRVYAGDLQGNLWRFDNDETGSWTLGNGGLPLFTATNVSGDVQPITSQPKVAPHPEGGVLVYFGTGSYLTTDDLINDDQQAFYAIWDADRDDTVTRAEMQAYTILEETDFSGKTVRITSLVNEDDGDDDNDGVLSWFDGSDGVKGWYLDLPSTASANVPAERVVSTPLVMEYDDAPDRILFVTNIPASDPCERGGTTWLMELDLLTGGRTATSVFDFDGDGDYDDSDLYGSGDSAKTVSGMALPSDYGITGEPLLMEQTTTVTVENEDGSTTTTTQIHIVKQFSGSTGKSGNADVGTQDGGRGSSTEAPNNAPPERIYWRQLL